MGQHYKPAELHAFLHSHFIEGIPIVVVAVAMMLVLWLSRAL